MPTCGENAGYYFGSDWARANGTSRIFQQATGGDHRFEAKIPFRDLLYRLEFYAQAAARNRLQTHRNMQACDTTLRDILLEAHVSGSDITK